MGILPAAHGNDAIVAVPALPRELPGVFQDSFQHAEALGPVHLELLPAFVMAAPAADTLVVEDDRRLGVLRIQTACAVLHALAWPSCLTMIPACARWRLAFLVLCSV